MALSKEEIRVAAESLHRAEKTRTQIRQLSLEFPDITIDDAYAIQKARIEIKLAEGRVVKGHKIGLTSKAMQSALNIDEPDSGVLLDDMFFADGGLVPSDRFIATRIEAELAFIMAKRLHRARLHDVRCAERHRFRGARAGNPRHQDRADRCRNEVDAKDLRYDC
jgi:2-oxo-hept-3-ene-1,7-dioate hydratase